MMNTQHLILRLWQDCRGTSLIETAIVAPVLAIMALGGFEASSMVARQTELQSAAAEAAAIVQSSPPKTIEARQTVHDIVAASTGLPAESVVVTEIYRCGTDADYTQNTTSCGTTKSSTYVKIVITDTYTPHWTEFGIGSPVAFNVVRTVQIA